MSEEELDNTNPADDLHITTSQEGEPEPPPKPPGAWEMPEPVFRKTSGYLPQGFQKHFPQSTTAAAPENAAAPAADVEPQPDISELMAADQPIQPAAAAPHARGPVSIVLIILGLIAMAVFAAAFLAVVYFLFRSTPADTSF